MCVLQGSTKLRVRILIASKDKKYICELKVLFNSEFEMKDLGDAKKILGMKIIRDRQACTFSTS